MLRNRTGFLSETGLDGFYSPQLSTIFLYHIFILPSLQKNWLASTSSQRQAFPLAVNVHRRAATNIAIVSSRAVTQPLLNAALCLPRGQEHVPVLDIQARAEAQTSLPPPQAAREWARTKANTTHTTVTRQLKVSTLLY